MGTIFIAGEFSNELLGVLSKEHRVILPRDPISAEPIWCDLFLIHEKEPSCDLLCWAARAVFRVPALVIGRDYVEVVVQCLLFQGADKYIRESVGIREILAHVNSVLRREQISVGRDSS